MCSLSLIFLLSVLSAGLIQDHFYAPHRPNYLNYGSLGTVIGHEMAHAFDKRADAHESDEEREIMTEWFNGTLKTINELLSLNSTNLWKNESLEAFNSKLECVVKELKQFEGSDNEKVLAENVADIVAIDVAYDAYVAWSKQYEEEHRLPGLPFTPKQLFWIQYGMVNCNQSIDNDDPFNLLEDYHPSSRYRVVNTLKHCENFAKDFKCPEGSVMNPIERCRIF